MSVDRIELFRVEVAKYRNALIGILTLLVTYIALRVSRMSSLFILNHFPNRVVPDDFLFELLPYNLAYEYLAEIILYLMVFIFLYFVVKHAKETLAYYWILGWLYMLFRAIVNVLTPFDRPLAPDLMHGIMRELDPSKLEAGYFIPMGMFPSGHLGLATLAYIAVRDVAPLWVDRLMLSLLFLEAVFMIASRGHYTIDVLGAVTFVVLIYLWGERYMKKYLVME